MAGSPQEQVRRFHSSIRINGKRLRSRQWLVLDGTRQLQRSAAVGVLLLGWRPVGLAPPPASSHCQSQSLRSVQRPRCDCTRRRSFGRADGSAHRTHDLDHIQSIAQEFFQPSQAGSIPQRQAFLAASGDRSWILKHLLAGRSVAGLDLLDHVGRTQGVWLEDFIGVCGQECLESFFMGSIPSLESSF